MNIKNAQHLFLLGIGGTGMRGLAWLLHEQGKHLSGTDSQLPKDLPQQYVLVPENAADDQLRGADLVIHTDAATAKHPLLASARAARIPVLSYPEAVGEIAADYHDVIAVAGTHGKSSTTAFLAQIMVEGGLNPTVLLGASVPSWQGKNARSGGGQYFLVEADEYRKHFLTIQPTHAILTTIDFDHPDYFDSVVDVVAAYRDFLHTLRAAKTVVATTQLLREHPDLPWPKNTIPVKNEDISAAPSPIPGDHMKHNAALAIALAGRLGIDKARARNALQLFGGLNRRMEHIGTYKTMNVISDYGHHPREIAATWSALRKQHPKENMAIIFEAHMEARLKAFFDQFVQILSGCKTVIVYPVFAPAGRETKSAAALTQRLGTEMQKRGTKTFVLQSKKDLRQTLDAIANYCPIAIAFTAGDLDNHLRQIVKHSTISHL